MWPRPIAPGDGPARGERVHSGAIRTPALRGPETVPAGPPSQAAAGQQDGRRSALVAEAGH